MAESDVTEFYGKISFDENHQVELPMLVTQARPGGEEQIVWMGSDATGDFIFPIPTWRRRECAEADGVGQECSGHGRCNDEGQCVCDEEWAGSTCSELLCPLGTYNSEGTYMPGFLHACVPCGDHATTLKPGSKVRASFLPHSTSTTLHVSHSIRRHMHMHMHIAHDGTHAQTHTA